MSIRLHGWGQARVKARPGLRAEVGLRVRFRLRRRVMARVRVRVRARTSMLTCDPAPLTPFLTVPGHSLVQTGVDPSPS